MDLNFDKPFILKSKKVKELVSLLNDRIEDKLKKSVFYEEDKEYFYFKNIILEINSFIRIKELAFKNLNFYIPKLIILKGKKINNFVLEKDEWLIVTYDIRNIYKSENNIYAFALS